MAFDLLGARILVFLNWENLPDSRIPNSNTVFFAQRGL